MSHVFCSIVFLSFWTCWTRGDHFSHFVIRHWHIDDSSGSYLVLPLALSRYLLTGQWRVTVCESDLCTWYSLKKKNSNIVIRKEWLWSATDFFVMFLLVFFFTWPCTTFNSIRERDQNCNNNNNNLILIINCCDNTMIKHMPCLVVLSAHWAMKGNSTWIRSLYLIFI